MGQEISSFNEKSKMNYWFQNFILELPKIKDATCAVVIFLPLVLNTSPSPVFQSDLE